MLIGLLIAVHIVVCLALVGVILLQRSEGGALGVGGGPSGFMTARGAGNLLTRSTAILGGAFFVISLTLTLLAGGRTSGSVTDRLDIEGLDTRSLAPAAPAPATTAPATTGLPTGPLPGTSSAAPGTITAPLPTVGMPAAGSASSGPPEQ